MVKEFQYSQRKFCSFTPEQQFKSIVKLLSMLEQNLNDRDLREDLIESAVNCYQWAVPEAQQKLPSLHELKTDSTPHDIIRIILNILRHYQPAYNDRDIEIFRFDGANTNPLQKVPYPITIIIDNLRSGYNLGSIFRTAECVQAALIYICGITPLPPCRQMLKSARETEGRVKYAVYSTETSIKQAKTNGLPVIALETVKNAKSLFDYKPTMPVAVILGNEALGIEEKILKQADEILNIPVFGWKNSLNVSNAFAVAAYWLSGIIQ